jgi:transposase
MYRHLRSRAAEEPWTPAIGGDSPVRATAVAVAIAPRFQCPRCCALRSWALRGGRRRCAQCRFDWRPGRLPLRLTQPQWRELVEWFVRGASSAQIAHETGLERKRVLRALTILRRAIRHAGPAHADRRSDNRRAPATLGLCASHGREWAEVIPDSEVEPMLRALRTRDRRHSFGSPALRRYAAVVYRGRLYRLGHAGNGRAVPFGRIEAFWAYVQRQLRAKGGIRRERLDLYLAEYSWRYNHRRVVHADQVRALLLLIRQPVRWKQ